MERVTPTPDTRQVYVLSIAVPYTIAVRADSPEDAERYVEAALRPWDAVRFGTIQDEGNVVVEDVIEGFPTMACRVSTPRP